MKGIIHVGYGLSPVIRYPEALAEGFDNTGCRYRRGLYTLCRECADRKRKVLLEAPFDPIRRQMNSVLLTIDLTKAVADEAIERKDCVVVSYRTLQYTYMETYGVDLAYPR